MSTFTGTVDYYRRYRPGIPTQVADILAAAAADTTPRRLLDLGTGTGQVVEALGPRFDDVIAVDPDPKMLDAARATLAANLPPHTKLTLVHAPAEEYALPDGWQAGLVTICRAFHWMDQPAVLARLDAHVVPHGAVAIFGDNSFWTATSSWKTAVRRVIQDFLGEERRAGDGVFRHHDRPYSEILAESPFSAVEEIRVPVRRTWSTESILGYLYSTSFAARHLFGGRLDEFETAVAAALREHDQDDAFVEDNEFLIRIGRRPRR